MRLFIFGALRLALNKHNKEERQRNEGHNDREYTPFHRRRIVIGRGRRARGELTTVRGGSHIQQLFRRIAAGAGRVDMRCAITQAASVVALFEVGNHIVLDNHLTLRVG